MTFAPCANCCAHEARRTASEHLNNRGLKTPKTALITQRVFWKGAMRKIFLWRFIIVLAAPAIVAQVRSE
jgi:hypothetical protein